MSLVNDVPVLDPTTCIVLLASSIAVTVLVLFVFCIFVCNIGGSLDCLYAQHRRRLRVSRVSSDSSQDLESGASLLRPASRQLVPIIAIPNRSQRVGPPLVGHYQQNRPLQASVSVLRASL